MSYHGLPRPPLANANSHSSFSPPPQPLQYPSQLISDIASVSQSFDKSEIGSNASTVINVEANPPSVTPPLGRESTEHATSSFVPVNRQGILRAEAGRGATATVIVRERRERTTLVGIIPCERPNEVEDEIAYVCKGRRVEAGHILEVDVLIYCLPVFGLGFSMPVSQDGKLDDGMKIPYACRVDETACKERCAYIYIWLIRDNQPVGGSQVEMICVD